MTPLVEMTHTRIRPTFFSLAAKDVGVILRDAFVIRLLKEMTELQASGCAEILQWNNSSTPRNSS